MRVSCTKPGAMHPLFASTRVALVALLAALLPGLCVSGPLFAQQANWIWAAGQTQGEIPVGPTHYRKTFDLKQPLIGELVIAADDEFQVYFNNELVGYGNGYDKLTKVDLTRHLRDGKNLLAIRATNTQGVTAAMAAIMRFQLEGETAWRWLATDDSWKSSSSVTPSWKFINFSDQNWRDVTLLGSFGTTQPWDAARLQKKSSPAETAAAAESQVAKDEPASQSARDFVVPDHFEVQQILDSSVGSLIAMAFNEFGQLIISREGGKLLLADLSESASGEVSVRQYCDAIKNVQGILPLNGDVYVTGEGPQGQGLYRLKDKDRDGNLEVDQLLVRFRGPVGEHGAHGLTLGPDGMIYVMVGNASGMVEDAAPASPITHIHEGEVIPRLEDPGGHASGIRAPGGTIVRVSPDGSRREIFASGIRNAYDLAFNRMGELFFHDSDMESDVGTPWYRPTRLFHATAGGEYGWRSGTAKFPPYFIDTIPGIADTGRGSPTGTVVYDHVMMPLHYHGAVFLGDWSEGRILAVHLTEDGDSWQARAETFLSAQALTVTDLAVGPDGALYFSTGGRGTEGGIYRVAWTGTVPEEFGNLQDTLSQIVGRPQPQSAWTRQKLAQLKSTLGPEWDTTLRGILTEPRNQPDYRLRALEIMTLYGPPPSNELLGQLATDPDPLVRRNVIRSIGWRKNPELLVHARRGLDDADPRVRRAACETLRHQQETVDWNTFTTSLRSASRTEALAARRLLESMPTEQWSDPVLASKDTRVFLQGATALMIVEPDLQNAYTVLARASALMEGYLGDRDFVDLLRVMQLALVRGQVDPDKIPMFRDRILAEFPAQNGVLNRELSRIVGFLGDARIGSQISDYLASSSDSDTDKLQVVLNLRKISAGFTGDQRMAVIAFLEQMLTAPAATRSNYSLYITGMLEDWSGEIDESQISEILQNGARWPSAAMAAFYKLPKQLNEEQIEWISEMDRQLKGRTDTSAMQARLGCIAVLGRSADDKSMYYLREIWRHESDRRDDVALALAQKPDGPNWPYLISSLNELGDDTAGEVLTQLGTVNKSPREPKFFRDAILTGYRLRQQGAEAANRLLEHWSGDRVEPENTDWQSTMKAWAKWFNDRYPAEQPISFEDQQTIGKFSVDQILTYMENETRPPRAHSGMLAFTRAQCVNCHRFNGQGESMGPDLSSLARRFSERETLRAILHPSEEIPSQYASKKVLTVDGQQHIGILTRSGPGEDYVLLDNQGEKRTFAADEVEEIVPASVSAMPEGLMDQLTMEEIRDLIRYLHTPPKQMAQAAGGESR